VRLPDRIVVGLLGVLLGSLLPASSQTAVRPPNLQEVPDVVSVACSDQDSRVVDAAVTASVLGDYGFDIRGGIWECSSLQTPWLRSGKVLVLRTIPIQTDTGENVTLLSVAHEPHLWVIPVSSGMVGYPNVPDEIHNRAAFNAMLAENRVLPPTPEMWVSLGIFYLNMVGIQIHVADWTAHGEMVHGLANSPSFFHKRSLQPSVDCVDEQCTVTINDTRVTSVTQNLTTWVLSFSSDKSRVIRLDGVEHEVKPLSELP